MRLFLLALLMTLLPMHSRASDSFALQVMAPSTIAIKGVATSAIATGATDRGHSPCHDQAPALSTNITSHPPCTGCHACMVCHTVGLPAQFEVLFLDSPPHSKPLTQSIAFASATAVAGFKPPIF